MPSQIYINLPVRNLNASMEFFTRLGFTFEPRFTDKTAACLVISEQIFVMLLTMDKFRGFTSKPICDAREYTEVLLALSCNSRQEVDEYVHKAVAAGGSTYSQPQDYGFMYGHGFQDLDGHIWEVFHMDMDKLPTE